MKNLDYVVNICQMDLQDYSSNQYQRLLQYAIMGFRDLHLYTMPTIKVAYLTPNDAMVADLPIDYEYYTKIGVCIGGQIWTLTVNDDMCLSRQFDGCGEMIVETNAITLDTIQNQLNANIWYFAPHFRNGQYVGEMYAMGGGFNELGYFRIDHEKNRIQFQSTVPRTQIVMEYKSNGAEKSGETVIPTATVPAIRSFVHWQMNEFDRSVGAGEKERLKLAYYNEFEKVKFLNWSFTKDEYLDECYANIYMTVKR